ncbi:MAG: protein-disulfide reductase DsbD N-terminal domain-containing protein [Muribaculaceae bacterium]|nr:protein-disulfide reductase DsbD N-terminal domain-containing protein [Muribaculaceae bacterium]
MCDGFGRAQGMIYDLDLKMNIRNITFTSALVLAALGCAAQMPRAVSWSASVERADTCTATFRAVLEPGWHLYALELPEGGPRPTEIDLSGSRGVTFTANPAADRPATQVDDEMFGMTLAWWDGTATFTVPFVVSEPDDACIEARISYMVCNGESCLPPRTEIFSLPINQK